MAVATFTPEAVFGLFNQLDEPKKNEFLRLFAKKCSARAAALIINSLSKIEQLELEKEMNFQSVEIILPQAALAAWEWFQENPKEEFEVILPHIVSMVKQRIEGAATVGGELQLEKYKAKRDRKIDPDTIKRNNEILDFIEDNPDKKKVAVAKRFDVTDTYIRTVLREKQKWRDLASENRTN